MRLVLSGRPWLALPLVVASAAAAAPAATRPPADPLDPAAPVPRVTYHSSLRDVPRHAEQPVGDWRAANDTVTRIGGWRTYLREAQQPPAKGAPGPSAAPSTPAPAAVAPVAVPPRPAAHPHHHHPGSSSAAPGRPEGRP